MSTPGLCTLEFGGTTATDFHVHTYVKATFFSVGILSMIASLFVGITIFSIKKLRVHPNSMIGYISIFEAISAYNTIVWICSTVEWIEYFGLEWVFHYTFFVPTTPQNSC